MKEFSFFLDCLWSKNRLRALSEKYPPSPAKIEFIIKHDVYASYEIISRNFVRKWIKKRVSSLT